MHNLPFVVLWKGAVEKSVENVEKLGFSTAIFDFSTPEGRGRRLYKPLHKGKICAQGHKLCCRFGAGILGEVC